MMSKYSLFCATATVAILLTLQGCKPSTLDAEIYTSDLQEVANGKSANALTTITFSMLGDDKKNILDDVISETKEMLPPDTKVSVSNGNMGKQIVIETTVPISANENVKSNSIAYFLLKKNSDGDAVLTFHEGDRLTDINKKISRINMMLGANLPASKTNITVRNDLKENFTTSGTAIFIAKKPYLYYSETLSRRDSVTFEFRGGEASIYSELNPIIKVTNIFSSDTKTSGVKAKEAKSVKKIENQPVAQANVSNEIPNPSFNCNKASSFSEKTVCSDVFLAKLDRALSSNYKLMLTANIGDGAVQDLRQTQRNWNMLKNKCRDKSCLKTAYSERIDVVCDYPVISGVHPICISSTEITE